MAIAYRCILEVLKWTTPQETLLHLSNISELWHCASESSELWTLFIEEADFPSEETLSSAKARFKAFLESDVRTSVLGVRDCHLVAFSCRDYKFTSNFGLLQLIMPSLDAPAVLLSMCEVLICGGDMQRKSAKIYHSDNRMPIVLPDMLHSRLRPSAVLYQRVLFVFGGFYDPSTAEKLDLDRKEWSGLPNMLSRHTRFTAARQRTSIYLCGGETTVCEVYSIKENSYSPLPFRLSYSEPALAFSTGQEVVVLTRMTKFVVREDRSVQKEDVDLPVS